MNDNIMSVGTILTDKDKRYRIIWIDDENVYLCEMDTSKFCISSLPYSTVFDFMPNDKVACKQDESFVFAPESLTPSIREKYECRLELIHKIEKEYGPTYLGLCGKGPKPQLTKILDECGISASTFWRTITPYLQSGMKLSSLVDARAKGGNKGKKYNFTVKPGRKPEYITEQGINLSDEDIEHFKEALQWYKSGRQKTKTDAYINMCNLYYSKTELIDGVATRLLLPESMRPTWQQFYYYTKKHLSKEEKDLIKTSAMEQRNDKRPLLSDSLDGVCGPGDIVEIDACEVDISLVSMLDKNQTVGRPIVYFMVDVYSRIILAASVAFDNNSILGVTNLFLNLADNKREFCAKNGIIINDNFANKVWPSNVIPRRLRVDRGSEFVSKEFDRICVELGIEKQIVPPGSGSMKGIVEQLFHQFHCMQNPYLEDYGLIEKRHDSNHHKEAILNIEQFSNMLINEILAYNQKYNSNYPMTKDMLEKDIEPIPASLWEYGSDVYGKPKPITDIEQYMFNLMTPIKAGLSCKGLVYNGLYYLADDPILSKEIYEAGRKVIPFNARIDMRSVGAIYYLRNNKLIKAPLNTRRAGNAEFGDLTVFQWEEYRKKKKGKDAKGGIYNQQIRANIASVNKGIVEDAKKEIYSITKDMRDARREEKQAISAKGKMENRLADNTGLSEADGTCSPDVDASLKKTVEVLPTEPRGGKTNIEEHMDSDIVADENIKEVINDNAKDDEFHVEYANFAEALNDLKDDEW